MPTPRTSLLRGTDWREQLSRCFMFPLSRPHSETPELTSEHKGVRLSYSPEHIKEVLQCLCDLKEVLGRWGRQTPETPFAAYFTACCFTRWLKVAGSCEAWKRPQCEVLSKCVLCKGTPPSDSEGNGKALPPDPCVDIESVCRNCPLWLSPHSSWPEDYSPTETASNVSSIQLYTSSPIFLFSWMW